MGKFALTFPGNGERCKLCERMLRDSELTILESRGQTPPHLYCKDCAGTRQKEEDGEGIKKLLRILDQLEIVRSFDIVRKFIFRQVKNERDDPSPPG